MNIFKAQYCMAIGGWGDTDGFRKGSATKESRKAFAQKVSQTMVSLGYDCVGLDWEYPGGNGQDYKTNPNDNAEVVNYQLLIAEIKNAIGMKELSISVPGLERDMIAFTNITVPFLAQFVDDVHVMAYDLMNRRDTVTRHHTSVAGASAAIQAYIDRGFSPLQLNLGFAFYAKWFTLLDGASCITPEGCPTAVMEDPRFGTDTDLSGSVTFESSNYVDLTGAHPANLTDSPDGSCGVGTTYRCHLGNCCSTSGYCGQTSDFCGTGCQPDYSPDFSGSSSCKDPTTTAAGPVSIQEQFSQVMANGGLYDPEQGAHYYIDAANNKFWSWDAPTEIHDKYQKIIHRFGLSGGFVWSLDEDSHSWEHLRQVTNDYKRDI